MGKNVTINLDFTVMWKDIECTRVVANRETNSIHITHYIDDLIKRGFNRKETTMSDVMGFLEERCFPRTRVDKKELLKMLEIPDYNPITIVRKTHGVLWDDYTWVKFKGETLVYDDVKVRD